MNQVMQSILERQKKAFLEEGPVTAEVRIDRLDRAIDLLQKYGPRLCDAMAADFGRRSVQQSKQTDIDASVTALMYAKENLREWVGPEKRKAMFNLDELGARAYIEYQPLGVIGCISPWNFPVQLTFGPLAGILSAGNRVMIKPSELTSATSELMKEIFSVNFDIEEIAIFTGGVEVGRVFSGLPFDHLLFTGAVSVGKRIMHAASENLVPVTLELGGKSPVVIGRSADIREAAAKVMVGKTINAGQICLSPDYVFIHDDCEESFVSAAKGAVADMYPDIKDNPDYTSVINERHFKRILNYIEDARQKGGEIIQINPANEDFDGQEHYCIPPTLILNPTSSMLVMKEEIFGPVLPVMKYSAISEVLDYIKGCPRPLALYYFGQDDEELTKVLSQTISGGVTINDVMMHAGHESLPFGGVGQSGMGSYHGYDGFKRFSHARSIYVQSDAVYELMASMRPPYRKS